MAQMLCGDEVPAVVLDVGSSNFRAGGAGEAAPKHFYKSVMGEYSDTVYCGDSGLRVLRPMDAKMAIDTPFSPLRDHSTMDSNAELKTSNTIDWHTLDELMQFGINSVINGCTSVSRRQTDATFIRNNSSGLKSSSDYSLFFTESHFDNLQKKQKLAEICFEQYSSPGFYIAPNAVLAGLSMCKPTALVIDIGASGTTVSPVVDGYALYKSVKKSPIGGNYFNCCLSGYLQQQNMYSSVKPWFDINQSPSSVSQYKDSFRRYHENNIINDLKHWMTVVPYTRLDANTRSQLLMDSLRIPSFTLPDGQQLVQSDALVTTAECLFQPPAHITTPACPTSWTIPSLTTLIRDSIFHDGVDVDVRKELLNNILIIGGGSLIDGVSQRLIHELTHHFTDNDSNTPKSSKNIFKSKTIASTMTSSTEKYHAAWIGGSIMSICGSFQQCWISQAEYNEHGSNILLEKL